MKSSYGYTIMSALIIAGIISNVEATFTPQGTTIGWTAGCRSDNYDGNKVY